MPPVSDLIRTAGWQQGSIANRADTEVLLAASVDKVPDRGEAPFRLVVVSQDCDLVREPDIEPFVELIFCKEVPDAEPLYQNGRNPRLLHIQWSGLQESASWLEISVHDRFRVQKKVLADLTVDKCTYLAAQDVRLLSRWIARRYTRPVFPDAFNLRLNVVDQRLERLFKSKESRVVTGIFLEVADDEYANDQPYDIAVRVTAKAEVWDDNVLRGAVENFEARLSSILGNCDGISIFDIQTLPEDDLTLADLRRFKRLDKDYRSLPEEEGVELPVDESGGL